MFTKNLCTMVWGWVAIFHNQIQSSKLDLHSLLHWPGTFLCRSLVLRYCVLYFYVSWCVYATFGLSELQAFGQSGLRTTGPSDYLAFVRLDRHCSVLFVFSWLQYLSLLFGRLFFFRFLIILKKSVKMFDQKDRFNLFCFNWNIKNF